MNFNFAGIWMLALVFFAGWIVWIVYVVRYGIRSWKDFIWPIVITAVTVAVLLTQ